MKNDAIWIVAAGALAAARHLPLPALLRAGRALGMLAHAAAGSARRAALENVARALPHLADPERRALVRACFAELGELLGESVALLAPRSRARLPPLTLTAEARQVIDDASKAARGVLFASAHLGPWERVAAALVEANVPLTTLARESYDPRFSRLYQRLRASTGVEVIWRAEPGAAARILRALRRGGVLGVPMDLRTRVSSRDVPFLGHPAPTAIGPARIALRVGAAVVVGTTAPSPPRPRPPLASPAAGGGRAVTATRIPTADLSAGEEGAFELTRRINAELSRRILALPQAWPWMHERWTSTADL